MEKCAKMSDYPKIYFGPMSKNIVDVLGALSEQYPVGLIPSRRQIEHDGGYVNDWSTAQFSEYVRLKYPNVLICRDHGGRLQGSKKDDGIDSISEDAKLGFDIIHIDPWKKYISISESASETARMIKHCLSINNNLKFEVGTEEAIHKYEHQELDEFLQLLKDILGNDFDSILYAVVQFGTAIVGTKNIGTFDRLRAKDMIKTCKKFGLLSKEHNGDYLSYKDIEDRFSIGLDSINIAPEFGVYESSCLIDYFIENVELEKLDTFFNLCYNSKKWEKWIPEIDRYKDNKQISFYDYLITRISGHYVFSNEKFKSIKNSFVDDILMSKLNIKINSLLEHIYG